MSDNDKQIIDELLTNINLVTKRFETLNQVEQIIIRQGRTENENKTKS